MLLLCVNLPQTTSYWILPPPQKLPVSKQKNTFKKNGGPRHPGSLQWLGGPFRLVYRNVDLESDTFLGRIYLALGGVKPRPPRSLIVNRDFSLLRFGDPDLNPWKLTWHWEIHIFNRKYIFIHGGFSMVFHSICQLPLASCWKATLPTWLTEELPERARASPGQNVFNPWPPSDGCSVQVSLNN